MSRPVLTLLGGVAAAIGAALLIGPGAFVASRGFVLVLLTIAAGGVVMTVVGRRAALRRRAEELQAMRDTTDTGHLRGARDEETDRGR